MAGRTDRPKRNILPTPQPSTLRRGVMTNGLKNSTAVRPFLIVDEDSGIHPLSNYDIMVLSLGPIL